MVHPTGVQLVGCPGCGLVYADIPTVKQITRQVYDHTNDARWKFVLDQLKIARNAENPPKPTVKKAVKITGKVTKTVVVKKTKNVINRRPKTRFPDKKARKLENQTVPKSQKVSRSKTERSSLFVNNK